MLVGAALLALVLGSTGSAISAPGATNVWNPGDDHTYVGAWQGELEYRAFLRSDPANQLVEYKRSAACLLPPASSLPCPQYDPTAPPLNLVCEAGAPVAPLWRRTRDSADVEFSDEWRVRSDWACPEDLLPPFSEADLRRLKIDPLEGHQQPASGPVLVQRPTIVFTEPEDRELRAVLFDSFGVDVVVTPVEYEWDFGDGSTLTTTEPGRPYPAFDLTHVYTELGARTITLTTTWTGRYRVDADPLHRWRDVDGTATTVDVGEEFEVISLRTRLTE